MDPVAVNRCRLAGMALFAMLVSAPAFATDPPSPQRQRQLAHWLRDDCGACHGMTRQGGLGSPLTAATLADKPASGLVATLLDGRPGTAMPPWRPFLTEDEAVWLIERLQRGDPLAVP